MKKLIGFVLLLSGGAVHAFAAQVAPEIDPSTATGAIALVSGALMVLRTRRK